MQSRIRTKPCYSSFSHRARVSASSFLPHFCSHHRDAIENHCSSTSAKCWSTAFLPTSKLLGKESHAPRERLSDGFDGDGTLAYHGIAWLEVSSVRMISNRNSARALSVLPLIAESLTPLLSMKHMTVAHCSRSFQIIQLKVTARNSSS